MHMKAGDRLNMGSINRSRLAEHRGGRTMVVGTQSANLCAANSLPFALPISRDRTRRVGFDPQSMAARAAAASANQQMHRWVGLRGTSGPRARRQAVYRVW
jgi:hypothetical protein